MQAMPGWAVIEPEEKKMEGLIEIPDTAKGEIQRGTVVEVTATYAKDRVLGSKDIVTWPVKKGDRVVFKKYHDQDLELDGKKYKVVELDKIMVIL